jgi:hypothetical protein
MAVHKSPSCGLLVYIVYLVEYQIYRTTDLLLDLEAGQKHFEKLPFCLDIYLNDHQKVVDLESDGHFQVHHYIDSNSIQLFLSSKTEMQNVIGEARNQTVPNQVEQTTPPQLQQTPPLIWLDIPPFKSILWWKTWSFWWLRVFIRCHVWL